MAHDEHFLERGVERMAGPELSLALRLYQEPKLVAYVLEKTDIASVDGRLALALDDGGEGPYVVLARDGGFVTCLGRGMRLGRLPALPRTRVDALIERYGIESGALSQLSDRDRIDACCAAATMGEFGQTRENMLVLQVVAPLTYFLHARIAFECIVQLKKNLRAYMPLVRGAKPNPRDVAALKALSRMYWGIAHDVPLLSVDVRSRWEEHMEGIVAMGGLAGFEKISPLHALRGTWMVAQVGVPVLHRIEKWFDEAGHTHNFVAAVLMLTTMALRHAHLRERILARLLADPPNHWDDHAKRLRSVYTEALQRVAADPAAAVARQLDWGRAVLASRCTALHIDPAAVWAAAGAATDQVAAVLATHAEGDVLRDDALLDRLFDLTPWLASCELADLYLPEAVAVLLRRPSRAEDGIAMLREFERRFPEKPVTVGPKVGRNDPCSCGSGRKFKHCCGN